MSAKSKKRSRSSDQVGGNASRGSVRNKKRQRRDGEDINGGVGGGNGNGKRQEKVENSEKGGADSAVSVPESRWRKRKRVEKRDDDDDDEDEDGQVVESSNNMAVARQAGDASSSAINVEAVLASPQSGINAATTTDTPSILTPVQIQKFNIPEKVTTKVFSHDWDLLCIKVRQSSRIRCKIRATVGHLSSAEPDLRPKKDTKAKEQQRKTQPAASDVTDTNLKNRNHGKTTGIKSTGTKKPTPIVLLQASTDAASKLISIVEIVKRESVQSQLSYKYFQYSGIEGRVEELRPLKKHKKKASYGSTGKEATAKINADDEAKASNENAQQQVGKTDENNDKPMRNLSLDEADCEDTTLTKTHVSDSEIESESDAFQTLAESRKKLRNMPYLTIYLSRTRIPLLNSAFA